MKNLMLILALAVVLTSAVVFAEEAVDGTDTEEAIELECFVDEDGDGVCDTCAKTAEECAAEAAEGKCDTCESCDEKTGE